MGVVHRDETSRSEALQILFEFLSLAIKWRNRGVDIESAALYLSYTILDGGKAMVGEVQLVSQSTTS